MSTTEPSSPPPTPPMVSNKQMALVVYILYFISYVVGITAVIGVVIAHIEVGRADPYLRSHYQFQIRTFWIGLLYLVIGVILCLVVVGIVVLLWWFVWTLVRCIKGVLALNENRPIENPNSWLFG